MLTEWMKQADNDANDVPNKDEENKDDLDKSQDLDLSENYVDKNVVRRRILDRLGEKFIKVDQTKNMEYFKNNLYDPLNENLYIIDNIREKSILGRPSVNASVLGTGNRSQGDPKLIGFVEENNLTDMVHLFHIEYVYVYHH